MKKFKTILKQQTDYSRHKMEQYKLCEKKLNDYGFLELTSKNRDQDGPHCMLSMKRYFADLYDVYGLVTSLRLFDVRFLRGSIHQYTQELRDAMAYRERPRFDCTPPVHYELDFSIRITDSQSFLYSKHGLSDRSSNAITKLQIYKINYMGTRSLVSGDSEREMRRSFHYSYDDYAPSFLNAPIDRDQHYEYWRGNR